MATVTEPIALDKSLNTTESPSRNVADVLAQELSAVATAIGGIAVPSADHVSYDNSVSGLSATDVQNALDEIVSDIPTVNNGTLTIQQNGTSIGSFSANTASNVTANIKTPTADKKTATGEFNTADGGLFSKCQINLVPVQSGSGDPSPDNVRPISGHTEVKLQRDGKNLVNFNLTEYNPAPQFWLPRGNYYLSLKTASGLSTAWYFGATKRDGTYCTQTELGISGWSTGGGGAFFFGNASADSFAFSIPDNVASIKIGRLSANNTIPVQIEKGSTATSFEPYLGHLYQVQIGSTVYGGYVDAVSGVMVATYGEVDLGTLSFTKETSRTINTYKALLTNAKVLSGGWVDSGVCEEYKPSTASLVDHSFSIFQNANVYIADDTYTDATAFTNAVNGVKLCYELATPTTINLTPQQIETLAGQNNLSTPLSGQSIETDGVEYKELFTFTDVKSYVDKKIPDAPTTDGTYTLTATVSGGVPTYSWV